MSIPFSYEVWTDGKDAGKRVPTTNPQKVLLSYLTTRQGLTERGFRQKKIETPFNPLFSESMPQPIREDSSGPDIVTPHVRTDVIGGKSQGSDEEERERDDDRGLHQ